MNVPNPQLRPGLRSAEGAAVLDHDKARVSSNASQRQLAGAVAAHAFERALREADEIDLETLEATAEFYDREVAPYVR